MEEQLVFHRKMRAIANDVAMEIYPYLVEGVKDRINPPKGTEMAAYHSMVGYIATHLKSLSYKEGAEENRNKEKTRKA